MRIRVKHTFDFGQARDAVGDNLLSPRAWDAARAMPGPFALPATRAEWEALAGDDDARARATDVAAVATRLGARSLCSHGVGRALLELNLARALPELELTVTEYAPRSAERLARLFTEAHVVLRDLTDADPPVADLHLMHRLDAELDDEQWHEVFARLVSPVIFVPNVVLDLRSAARELGRRALRRRRLTAAGWFRNDAALRALWSTTHTDRRIAIGGAPSYLLLPR